MRDPRILPVVAFGLMIGGITATLHTRTPVEAVIVSDEEAATIMGGEDLCNVYAQLKPYIACDQPGCIATAAYKAGGTGDAWYSYKLGWSGPCPTPLGDGTCSAVHYGDFKGCATNPLPGGGGDPSNGDH